VGADVGLNLRIGFVFLSIIGAYVRTMGSSRANILVSPLIKKRYGETKMLKAITAVLFTAVLFVSLGVDAATVVSGVTGIIEPSREQISVKGDRLQVRPAGSACSKSPWPYYETHCLRGVPRHDAQARVVRVIAIDRLSARRHAVVN
jgi:hypothetical protein